MALLHQKLNAKQLFCVSTVNILYFMFCHKGTITWVQEKADEKPHFHFVSIIIFWPFFFVRALPHSLTRQMTFLAIILNLHYGWFMTYGFKLVMIGNMCTRLQAVQNIQFHFQNFALCFFHISHKEIPLDFDDVLHSMYVLHKSKQKPGTGGQLFLTSVCYFTQKAKNAWISFKFQLHFLNQPYSTMKAKWRPMFGLNLTAGRS